MPALRRAKRCMGMPCIGSPLMGGRLCGGNLTLCPTSCVQGLDLGFGVVQALGLGLGARMQALGQAREWCISMPC